MLVLSRRVDEKLLIPCVRTAIQVLSIQGGQVRLGIEAPAEVAVFREEILPNGPKDRAPAPLPPRDRIPGLLRNRLAQLALGLDRLQRQMPGPLPSAAREALGRLGDDFDELSRIVNGLLDDDAPETKRPVGCSR